MLPGAGCGWGAYRGRESSSGARGDQLRQVKGNENAIVVVILLIPQCVDGVGARDLDRVPDDRGDRDPERDQSGDRRRASA